MGRIAAAALVLLALPAGAAAATWTEPANVSQPHLFADDPQLTITADGTAVATWTWQDTTHAPFKAGSAMAVRPPGASAFGAETALPKGVSGRAVATGAHRLWLLGPRLTVYSAQAGAPLRRQHVIGPRPHVARRLLTGDGAGNLVVAWFENRGVRSDRVYAATRRAGKRWSEPVLLARGRIRNVTAAVDAGDVLVAWEDYGVIRTRLRLAGERRFRKTDTIRSKSAFYSDLHALVGTARRFYVAWGSQLLTEGGDSGPVYFQAAVRPRGARRFGRAKLLEQLPATAQQRGIALAAAPQRSALVSWVGAGPGGAYQLRRAEVVGTRWLPPEDVAGAAGDLRLDDMAVGDRGSVLAFTAFAHGSDTRSQVLAAVAPASGELGAAQALTPVEEAHWASAALDPLSGLATVTWSNRPGGSSGPLAGIRTYVQDSSQRP